MNENRLAEATRLEGSDHNFEAAIALLLEVVRDEPNCIEAYIHLAADTGILKRFRQAEQYARAALRINPQHWEARYYLALALRDQFRLEEASTEIEQALSLARQAAYGGSIGQSMGLELPLLGQYKKVEDEAKNLRVQLVLKGRRRDQTLFETPQFTVLPGGRKTYRNDRHGFQIDIPERWQLPDQPRQAEAIFGTPSLTDPHDFFQFNCPEEAFNFVINPLGMQPELEDTEAEFILWAHAHQFYDVVFSRMMVGGREHVCARYRVEDRMGTRWNKKYMIVFGGIEYSITGTCSDPQVFARRELDWDAIVSTFRLLIPIDDSAFHTGRHERMLQQRRDITEQRLMLREVGGSLYQQAYEAFEMNDYAKARALLEQCLRENPDHLLAHKEMAVLLKKLGNKMGALRHRKEARRLDPTDTINRTDLVDLLAGCGRRKEALREADALIKDYPNNVSFQQLKTKLVNEKQPNYGLRVFLSLAYFTAVILFALTGKPFVVQYYWLWALLCLPAAHYLNQGGRWIGMDRKTANWVTMILYLATVYILLFKHGMQIGLVLVLSIAIIRMGWAILADNALKD
jgi:tetratricopeptide (TPR) repeat protein